MSLHIALLIAGLALLLLGAEVLVRGASRLAVAAGISPLVVGLTVVAYGTSAPELAVSAGAALNNQGSLALGNIIGSNIFNVLLILGASAAIRSLAVSQQLVRVELWLLVAVSLLTFGMGLNGSIGRLEGATLFAGALVFSIWSIKRGRRNEIGSSGANRPEAHAEKPQPWLRNAAFVLLGLALLVVGARWLVGGAVALAQALGISEIVIGLTIVAAGTSLPEVATSVVASLRGEQEIAVGNVIGSNLFNLLAVLGVSAILAPAGIPVTASALAFDLPVMILVAVACLPIFFTGYRVDRWEGWLFLAYYGAYVVYLILDATRGAALDHYRAAMIWVALPLTAITLLVATLLNLERTRRIRDIP